MERPDMSMKPAAPRPTVLIDLDGRYLGIIGIDGKLMDVDIVSTSLEGDAFESDDEIEGTEEQVEMDINKLAFDLLSKNARSTYTSQDFLNPTQTYSPAVGSESYREKECVDALFDPKFVSESRDLRTEGLFSEEEDGFDLFVSSDEDTDDNDASFGIASDAKFGLFGRKKKKKGRLVATYIFVHKDYAWVVSKTEEKSVWEFPTFEVLDKNLTPENVTQSDLMVTFLAATASTAAPKSADAFKIIPIGKRHVVYMSRLDSFEGLGTSRTSPSVPYSYNTSVWVPWKKLRVTLRPLSFPGELDFKRKTRKTMQTLRSLGYVDAKRGFALTSTSTASSTNFSFSDGETDSDTQGFDYYSLSQGAFVRHDAEDDHLFFSGQHRGRVARGPSGRGRSRSRGRARGPLGGRGRSRSPLGGRGRSRSRSRGRSRSPPPRTSVLPGPLRRGLRRGTYGKRGGLKLPNYLLPRPFHGTPDWGRGWYRRRSVRPFVPYLPLAFLGIRNLLFPRRYVHIAPMMPYYDDLPPLPSIDPYATPSDVAREIEILRSTHRRWLSRGYDIVPDFDRYRYYWVRRANAIPLAATL